MNYILHLYLFIYISHTLEDFGGILKTGQNIEIKHGTIMVRSKSCLTVTN